MIPLLFFTLLIFAVTIAIYTLVLGISPMPSSKKAKEGMIRLLPNDINGVIYELGCGWGGLALLLARRFPKATVIAFELSPVPYLISSIRKSLTGSSNLQIMRKNFYEWDLSNGKVIVCYLFCKGMRRLSPKLKKELPKNSIVISNSFSLPEWERSSRYFLNDWGATRIYRYDRH